MRIAPAQFYTPRRALLRLHRDLFQISLRIRAPIKPRRLSDFEIMVLVLEDRRFFRHAGVDFISCLRELVRAASFRRFGGASTIDMQLVRTATGYRKYTLRRKLYEMLLAWIIQFRYTKFEILESYLDCAYFGSGIFGQTAATSRIYGKPPSDLSLVESAELASMLVYPRPLQPSPQWSAKLRRRADYAKRLYPGLKQRFEKLPSSETV